VLDFAASTTQIPQTSSPLLFPLQTPFAFSFSFIIVALDFTLHLVDREVSNVRDSVLGHATPSLTRPRAQATHPLLLRSHPETVPSLGLHHDHIHLAHHQATHLDVT
jgi:hypothetical protein